MRRSRGLRPEHESRHSSKPKRHRANQRSSASWSTAPTLPRSYLALFVVACFPGVCEQGDAPRALEAKRCAHAIIGARVRGNRGGDLNDRQDVIRFRKRGWILAPHIRDILKPRTGFRIDYAELLNAT